jgi:hypothetical protein
MGLTREIVSRAVKDEAFRKRLVADPKATIAKEFAVELGDDVTVRIHQDTPGVINLVIPAAPDLSAQRPLSDQQLDQVAGGLVANQPQLSGPRPQPGSPLGGLAGGGLPGRGRLSPASGVTFGAVSSCCNTSSFC